MNDHARYIDVHVLQTVPPSNINRDDSGTPKTATYGGVRRSRVSSQAWKRATRMLFAEGQPTETGAVRTKRIARLLTESITRRCMDLDEVTAARIATVALEPLGVTPSQKKTEETSYLLFFGRDQLDNLADAVAEHAETLTQAAAALDAADTALQSATKGDKASAKEEQKAAQDVLDEAVAALQVLDHFAAGHPIDVALFGRFVADTQQLNVDASCQVAHAISTHRTDVEFDYFTAVDDENVDDSGAGMIGTVEFNSATLYRYATVDLDQLTHNFGGELTAAHDAVIRFLDAFVRSIPSGHQNTFAHRTLPHAVVVDVRADQPTNLVSAFEKPVRAFEGGHARASLTALAAAHTQVTDQWGAPPITTAATYDTALADDAVTDALPTNLAFPALLDHIRAALTSSQGRA